MSELSDLLHLAQTAERDGVDAVLATVVHTEGSAYRRAGAMMLICEDGRSVGMISGGCLEPHIIKRAFWLTRTGSIVQVYQTGDGDTDDDDYDDALNFGLGCNGRVHVLFERLSTAAPLLSRIRQVRDTQQPALVATLVQPNCSKINPDVTALPVGARLWLDNTEKTSAPDANEHANLLHVAAELQDKGTLTGDSRYVLTAQGNTWLVQRLCPQLRLLICGAGTDVPPLVVMAKMQDWHVTVIDSRAHYATRARFMAADSVQCVSLGDTDTLLTLSRGAAIALMSHSLSQDRARLQALLPYPEHYHYLGQLGPVYRTERLLEEIREQDPAASFAGLDKLHYPIGYKLGGDGAAALALGIMAQMQEVLHSTHSNSAAPSPSKTLDRV
ncbi:XdhC family protein [Psychrobacter aestuarii]|uniref:XdhC family protein n=1 Tax=Psychrobacter aestuarii TaxID=556327 RepID=A0ABP3FL87_9GAMM|nr:XdhC/CoxI family protein [Psychrobacter aestuarii]